MSPRTVCFEVTAEDIRLGKRKDSSSCPIARAIRRKTGKRASVSQLHVAIGHVWFSTPDDMAEWITRFDTRRSSVKPSKFRLKLPESP